MWHCNSRLARSGAPEDRVPGIEEELVTEAENPLVEGIECNADETRLHYAGGLSEDLGGPAEETFEAE